MKKTSAGFAPIYLIIILFILGVMGGAYYYGKSSVSKTSVIDFNSCKKAGYPIRLLNCQGCPKYCDTPWGASYSEKQ
ncbi:MAG: hypothetical protein PHQ59_01325 [Candidatus Daviesbacteria bacterium]|nr:hypothetical protein [Candidatus Daviesbacteria bacterium]